MIYPKEKEHRFPKFIGLIDETCFKQSFQNYVHITIELCCNCVCGAGHCINFVVIIIILF